MFVTALLLGILTIAAVTDVRQRKVFNWTTYPGTIVAFLTSALGMLFNKTIVQTDPSAAELWGIVPLSDCLIGFLACGFLMLVCYVFFPGGVGGGDVKLIAMVGAFVGLYQGLEVLLWTFVLGACQALIALVWKVGAVQLVRRAAGYFWFLLRFGGHVSRSSSDSSAPTASMYLSPSALVSVLIVRFHLAEWFRF